MSGIKGEISYDKFRSMAICEWAGHFFGAQLDTAAAHGEGV